MRNIYLVTLLQIYASENGGGSWSLMYKADTGDIVHQVRRICLICWIKLQIKLQK